MRLFRFRSSGSVLWLGLLLGLAACGSGDGPDKPPKENHATPCPVDGRSPDDTRQCDRGTFEVFSVTGGGAEVRVGFMWSQGMWNTINHHETWVLAAGYVPPRCTPANTVELRIRCVQPVQNFDNCQEFATWARGQLGAGTTTLHHVVGTLP